MTRPDDHRRPGPPRLDRRSAARRHGRVALAVLALALMSAACGGGDSDDESGGVVVRDISVDTVDGADITATEPADDAGSSAEEDGENTPAEPDDEPTATTLPHCGCRLIWKSTLGVRSNRATSSGVERKTVLPS